MEKQQDLTLLKARSYRSVLSAGFRLYTENFRRLFKASWQMVLLYAIVCGWLGTVTAIKIPEMSLAILQGLAIPQGLLAGTIQQYALILIGFWGLVLLAIVTFTLASATILNKLKEHKETGLISVPPHCFTASPKLMGRTLKGVFLTLFVLLLPLLLFGGLMAIVNFSSPHFVTNHVYTTIVVFLVCTVIVMLLSLPLFHVFMKYIMEAPCGYWHTLNHNYGKAASHWGSLFLVFFVSILLIQLASVVILMPSFILNLANQTAQRGLLMGDPLGMPSYMTTLTFITVMLCSFIHFYVGQMLFVHNYYAYGAIETREIEKTKIENP